MHLLPALIGKLLRPWFSSRTTIMEYNFRNDIIFPEYRPGYPDYSYPPDLLLDKILKNRDSVDGVGNIYISSAKYCKQTKEARHEFLIFDLFDNTSDRKNVIIIDRVPRAPEHPTELKNAPFLLNEPPMNHSSSIELQSPPSSPEASAFGLRISTPRSRGCASSTPYKSMAYSKSNTDPASDLCHVSATGGLDHKGLTERKKLRPFSEIARMKFVGDSFTLERLLVLAQLLSESKPMYNLIESQCYWYALSLWELVQRSEVHRTIVTDFHKSSTNLPATHPYAPGFSQQFNSDKFQEELSQVVNIFLERWQIFEENLLEHKKRGVKALLARQ